MAFTCARARCASERDAPSPTTEDRTDRPRAAAPLALDFFFYFTSRISKTCAQLRSFLSRARCSAPVLSRGRARTQVISSTSVRVSLELLEKTRRQGCLSARPGCLERFRLSRGRLELSRAARLSREGSGYLERSGYLEGASGQLGPQYSSVRSR